MMRVKFFISIFAAVAVTTNAWSGQQDAVRSCYAISNLSPPKAGAVDTALFVVVDQTTLLDERLKKSVSDNVSPLLQPGNSFGVVRFAAFMDGYYTEVLVTGTLDAPMPQAIRDDTSKPLLSKFDNCMKHQLPFARKLVDDALKSAFGGIDNKVAKSDILASLKEISSPVRQSTAKQKIVLLVSDMLENSSITSFYASNAVRQIDAKKELDLATTADVFGDFGSARVFVIGAGLLAETGKQSKGVYRDPKIMRALSDFWKEYFQRSHAELVEFGQPALLNPIR